jgi:hypothetical protein
LSITDTDHPLSSSESVVWLPMKPLPPVISTLAKPPAQGSIATIETSRW